MMDNSYFIDSMEVCALLCKFRSHKYGFILDYSCYIGLQCCSDWYIVLLGPHLDQHSSKLICQPWMYFLTWNKYQFKLKVTGVWYSIQ